MELYPIEKKQFKNLFFPIITIMAIAIAGSYLLLNNGYIILSNFDPHKRLTWPIMIGLVVVATYYGYYRKKRLERLHTTTKEFDEQVAAYVEVYKLSLRWHLFSCLITCFLAVLTPRNIFIYFALFEVLYALILYPNKVLFRKELRNNEIILY